MRTVRSLILFSCISIGFSSCIGTIADTWENTKTLSRVISSKTQSIFKTDSESQLVKDSEELFYASNIDYIPLAEDELSAQFVDYAISQSKTTPGEEGGSIPGIDKFKSTQNSSTFTTIYFQTDYHTPKTKEDYATLHSIATYLKKHPKTYVFIEGHCDERASEAYNLSLGTRRSNYIRNFLIKENVSKDQLFTISYGKEKPAIRGHTREAWAKNRRVEFKIYERR